MCGRFRIGDKRVQGIIMEKEAARRVYDAIVRRRIDPGPDRAGDGEPVPPQHLPLSGGERLTDDKRWQYGTPPKGNANFAWVQHMMQY